MSADKMTEEPQSRVPPTLQKPTHAAHPLADPLALALRGAVFPLRRELVVRVARENDAPPTLLSLLAELPVRELTSLDDVVASIEKYDAEAITPLEPEAAQER